MNQKNRLITAAFVSLLAAIALAGCGSGNKEGASQGGSTLYGGVATVSETACASCHSSTVDPQTGEPVYGDGTNGYIGSIHQLGYGCQGCHGGGAGHNGIGPLPYPDPALSSSPSHCATCHSDPTIVSTVDTSIAKFVDSRHNLGELETSQKCNRCHTHQGAILSNNSGFTGDKNVMDALVGAPGDIADADAKHIKCNTCHVSHRPENLRTVSGWDPSGVAGSAVPTGNAQYKLCTSCHTYLNPDGTLVASGSTTSGTAPFYHNTRWYRMIASTHFDNPATPGESLSGVPGKVEGYVLRTNGANPCMDCHGHEYITNTRQDETPPRSATIYTDWAKSAHGGQLLTAKYAAAAAATNRTTDQVDAVMAAGSIDDADIGGPAWTHYNWDNTASRGSCQRCHTATGASNFMTDPAAYDPANNDFSHLSGWSSSGGSPQNELLYCWGCHSNAANGVLRTPGAITEVYGDVGDPTTTISYPDISGSNVCMTCHLGREIGAVIKSDQDSDGVRSFINSHYLTAGGQLFGTSGYEYDGRSYANPSYFAHDKIGSAAAPGTGTNGPCVGCHMRTPNSHSFLPVTKDETTGAITAITSTACATCHTGGYALTASGLTTEEEEYQAAISALMATLASKGIYFYEAHPYFYNGAGGTAGAFTNWAGVYGLALWKDVMGAAFNANLLIHDPGGYAHNRFYSKRLIWDSIDFIYDGVLNDDVTAAIDAQETATRIDSTTAAEAKAYLGTARP